MSKFTPIHYQNRLVIFIQQLNFKRKEHQPNLQQAISPNLRQKSLIPFLIYFFLVKFLSSELISSASSILFTNILPLFRLLGSHALLSQWKIILFAAKELYVFASSGSSPLQHLPSIVLLLRRCLEPTDQPTRLAPKSYKVSFIWSLSLVIFINSP